MKQNRRHVNHRPAGPSSDGLRALIARWWPHLRRSPVRARQATGDL